MKWMTSMILLAAIGGAHLQCFTSNDDFQSATYSTNLSGIGDFGVDLYKQLSPGRSRNNFFFSPYSIWSALALAYFGSAGNTQKQLEATLRVSDKISTIKLWKALGRLYEDRQSNTQYTFNLANRAYFDESIQLRSCTGELLRNELRTLNSRDLGASANDINNFVSETTNGRISNIVTTADISNVLMVLVNAAYFKGTWKYKFESSSTTQRDFSVTPQDSSPVAMMSQQTNFRYGESSQLGARVLELPYEGDAISMFILLPYSDAQPETRFARMVSNLNGATLLDAINPRNLQLTDVEVQLPKFKFELTLENELLTALGNLGISDLFNDKLANMTTFTPYGNLAIGRAIHKAFVEVNEEGTEAAAATILITRYSIAIQRANPVLFHCNEPFVYFIHDKQTNNILFLGTFKDPRGL